jgi:hypothetical protein
MASTLEAPTLSGPAPLALAQHVDALWRDPLLAVDAVVMGARVPGLRSRLATSDCGQWDCLRQGVLTPAQEQQAPYLVRLARPSRLAGWLLHEAAAGFGPWGMLVRSRASFVGVRTHFRTLARARLPDGGELEWPWMDPEVMLALLPMFGLDQCHNYFGPVHSIVIVEAARWTVLEIVMQRLVVTSTGVLPHK